MTGIFIVARLGSARLPQKHLIEAAGKPFIEWLVTRYVVAFQNEIKKNTVQIFIVTSENIENKKFESVFAQLPFIKIFYGSENNIPLRQLQCAIANNVDEIISSDGDDVLCSTHAAILIREHLLNGSSLVKSAGLPIGMNVMGYPTKVLQTALRTSRRSILETGWGRIFNNNAKSILLGNYDMDARLRLTLDYEEDAIFFSAVINKLKEQVLAIEDETLINFILNNKLYEINQQVNDVYWENFNQQKNAEE